jgi:hypothetical protein
MRNRKGELVPYLPPVSRYCLVHLRLREAVSKSLKQEGVVATGCAPRSNREFTREAVHIVRDGLRQRPSERWRRIAIFDEPSNRPFAPLGAK